MTLFIRFILLYCFTSLYVLPSSVFAVGENSSTEGQEIRYISDFLVINIKSNVERPYTVTAKVFSGDKVTVLRQKNDYLYVQTEDGSEGWISKQYLKKETPKTIIIEQLKKEIRRLQALQISQGEQLPTFNSSEKENACEDECLPVQQKLTEAKQKIIALEDTLTHKEQSLADQKGNLALAKLHKQYEKIQQQLKDTNSKYKLLSKEYENRTIEIASLESVAAKKDDKTRFMWFGAGAAVFFLGILFGQTGSKKKNKYLY